jgi:hypothetical protein
MPSALTATAASNVSTDGPVHALMHVWPVNNGDSMRHEASWELELLASHTSNRSHLDPSCAACSRLRLRLHSIAMTVVERLSATMAGSIDFDVSSGIASIICSPSAGPCVSVSIHICDRRGDDSDQNGSPNVITRIKEALKGFGVREH